MSHQKNLMDLNDYGRLVFVPNKTEGYILAQLVDIGADSLNVEIVGKNSDLVIFSKIFATDLKD